MALPPPPSLLDYVTDVDEPGMRYVARYVRELPVEALTAGCLQEVSAATVEGLTQAAVRNRIRIECWTSGQVAERFTTGDLA